MVFMAKMMEIQLKMQDEIFARTNVEQEELEENLMSFQADPVVGAKMRELMMVTQSTGMM